MAGNAAKRLNLAVGDSTITVNLFARVLAERDGDALGLYAFLLHHAAIQQTNQAWLLNSFITRGLKWGKGRVQKAKRALRRIGLVEDVVDKDPKTHKIRKRYLKLKYVNCKMADAVSTRTSHLLDFQQVEKPAAGNEPQMLNQGLNACSEIKCDQEEKKKERVLAGNLNQESPKGLQVLWGESATPLASQEGHCGSVDVIDDDGFNDEGADYSEVKTFRSGGHIPDDDEVEEIQQKKQKKLNLLAECKREEVVSQLAEAWGSGKEMEIEAWIAFESLFFAGYERPSFYPMTRYFEKRLKHGYAANELELATLLSILPVQEQSKTFSKAIDRLVRAGWKPSEHVEVLKALQPYGITAKEVLEAKVEDLRILLPTAFEGLARIRNLLTEPVSQLKIWHVAGHIRAVKAIFANHSTWSEYFEWMQDFARQQSNNAAFKLSWGHFCQRATFDLYLAATSDIRRERWEVQQVKAKHNVHLAVAQAFADANPASELETKLNDYIAKLKAWSISSVGNERKLFTNILSNSGFDDATVAKMDKELEIRYAKALEGIARAS